MMSRSLFSRITVLFIAALSILSIAPSAHALDDFSGFYKLTRAVYGYCEDNISVFDGRNKNGVLPTISVGSRVFSGIDRGVVVRNDSLTRERQRTVSTRNSITEVDYNYNKAVKMTYVYRLTARWSRGGQTMSFYETNSAIPSLPTSCVYRRLPKDNSPVTP